MSGPERVRKSGLGEFQFQKEFIEEEIEPRLDKEVNLTEEPTKPDFEAAVRQFVEGSGTSDNKLLLYAAAVLKIADIASDIATAKVLVKAGAKALLAGGKKALGRVFSKGVKESGEEAAEKGLGLTQKEIDEQLGGNFDVPKPTNPANQALHEGYKDSLRASMGRPHVEDANLSRIMDDLYRPGAKVGSGSTAAAVRHEIATGTPVGGRLHSQKAREAITRIQKWIKRNATARPGDRAAAENVLRDLQNALGGK